MSKPGEIASKTGGSVVNRQAADYTIGRWITTES
jgi:hypothetical protein